MSTVRLIIDIEKKDEKNHSVNISYPESQPKLTVSDMARIMAAGISLCVKLANEEGLVKDYELMNEITTYLNNEFISIDSFSDAEILNKDDK